MVVLELRRDSRVTTGISAFPLGWHAEFQRIARRDKKAFLSEQWKELEENNRMGKTRDVFKKIRDTNGTFYHSLIHFMGNR